MAEQQHYALITGASKGIGKAIAEAMAAKGVNILAVARTGPLLEKLCTELKAKYNVDARWKATDLLEPGSEQELVEWVASEKVPLDILVNNAGYGLWGRFHQLEAADMRKMLQLNTESLMAMCHAFVPVLRKRPKAWILNVGSTAGYQAVPTMAAYSGSKAFVNTFSRALRFELRKTGLSVSLLSPGATESNFTDRAGMQAMQAVADKFNMTAEKVAAIAVRGMFRGKAEIVPGALNKISTFFVKVMPKIFAEKMAANIYQKYLPKDE